LNAQKRIPKRRKLKFLKAPVAKSFEIIELKIRYKQNNKINFTALFDKNLYSFLYNKRKTNEKSISKITIKDIAGPKIIETGIIENSMKK
tara:strand:+ start:13 stop:282 length:270 start_codon:yes stop_codon:yes gene_type:complete